MARNINRSLNLLLLIRTLDGCVKDDGMPAYDARLYQLPLTSTRIRYTCH